MLATMLDRRLSLLLVSRVRRRWPLMRLVPTPVMLPLLAPVARRVWTSVARVAAVLFLAAGVALATALTVGSP